MNQSSRYLYHYTNKEGVDGIRKSGVILPSTDTRRDAIMGKAVYLTDIAPCNKKYDILENNYGADPGRRTQDRADYYVKIPRDSVRTFKANDPSREVYRSAGEGRPVNLTNIEDVKIGHHGRFEIPIENTSDLNKALYY